MAVLLVPSFTQLHESLASISGPAERLSVQRTEAQKASQPVWRSETPLKRDTPKQRNRPWKSSEVAVITSKRKDLQSERARTYKDQATIETREKHRLVKKIMHQLRFLDSKD